MYTPVLRADVPALPTAGSKLHMVAAGHMLPAAGNAGASALSTGVYIGEELPPVPLKLAEKIRRWDYTDMSKLLPEFWAACNKRVTRQASREPQPDAGER